MMIGRLLGVAVLGLALSCGVARAGGDQTTTPYAGPARSIGSPANGCLGGAVALPLSGPHWDVLHPERNRYWGHPALIAFLERMADRTAKLGRLMIGDLGQPRGGRMPFGHASHQIGLDVDILYRLSLHPLSDEERIHPPIGSMVGADGQPNDAWTFKQIALVKAFAEDPAVDRIFVNPAIKRTLCRTAGTDRAWLRRLRPWWGHAAHFHVRLTCPAGATDCVASPPVPVGDGCGAALDWWFTDEAKAPKPHVGPPPTPPAACKAILGG